MQTYSSGLYTVFCEDPKLDRYLANEYTPQLLANCA